MRLNCSQAADKLPVDQKFTAKWPRAKLRRKWTLYEAGKMDRAYFDQNHLLVLDEVVIVAEDMVSDFFKLSSTDWKSAPYDVKTLKDLGEHEIVAGVFAQVTRYKQDPFQHLSVIGRHEFYKICLHDHEVLKAIHNRRDMLLFPLLLYIMLHELVHIVRFRRFLHRFDAPHDDRQIEEIRVHQTTSEILKTVRLDGIGSVLKNYENIETLAECAVLAKVKEGEDLNRRNTSSILRIKI